MSAHIPDKNVVSLQSPDGSVEIVFRVDSPGDLHLIGTAKPQKEQELIQVECLRVFYKNIVIKAKGDV